MKVERVSFPGSGGQQLAARLDASDEETRAYALFAHFERVRQERPQAQPDKAVKLRTGTNSQ